MSKYYIISRIIGEARGIVIKKHTCISSIFIKYSWQYRRWPARRNLISREACVV